MAGRLGIGMLISKSRRLEVRINKVARSLDQ